MPSEHLPGDWLFDPAVVPFSFPRSYLALAWHKAGDWSGTDADGLCLRDVHTGVATPIVGRFELIGTDGSIIPSVRAEATPGALRLSGAGGKASILFAFADAETVVASSETPGVGLRLKFLPEGMSFNYIFDVVHGGRSLRMAVCAKNSSRYLMDAPGGTTNVSQDWVEKYSTSMAVDFQPASPESRLSVFIKSVRLEWDRTVPVVDLAAASASATAQFREFAGKFATPRGDGMQDARDLASYVMWSGTVKAEGFLKRDAMLMSKNWMNRVWSWDHAFNALALAPVDANAAVDQFLCPFDLQDSSGRVPDFVSAFALCLDYVKPPVHGWILKRIARKTTLPEGFLAEAYDRISRATEWWLANRDRDGDGLYEYDHGNDSGWDNATCFAGPWSVATPDLQALLALQMKCLADFGVELGRPEDEVRKWRTRADKLVETMCEHLFSEDLTPLIRIVPTGEFATSRTLLMLMPLILGDALPQKFRAALLSKLDSGAWDTPWGLATEPPDSPDYRPDGYWRGPIWAPATVLFHDALLACGREDAARELAAKFFRLFAKGGAAENFDALTGEGLRDRAYTWTSAAFLALAHDHPELCV